MNLRGLRREEDRHLAQRRERLLERLRLKVRHGRDVGRRDDGLHDAEDTHVVDRGCGHARGGRQCARCAVRAVGGRGAVSKQARIGEENYRGLRRSSCPGCGASSAGFCTSPAWPAARRWPAWRVQPLARVVAHRPRQSDHPTMDLDLFSIRSYEYRCTTCTGGRRARLAQPRGEHGPARPPGHGSVTVMPLG